MAIARVIADADHLSASFDQGLDALAKAGFTPALVQIVDEGDRVAELVFADGDPVAIHQALRSAMPACDSLVAGEPISVPQLVVSDMDSTMIGQECIDELADYAGLKPQIAAITERAMAGELDFEAALKERVGLLAGLPVDDLDRCLAERIAPNPGARELIATLKAKGAFTVLVTGGFHHFADAVGAQLGFDRVVANRLGVSDGKLTGEVVGPVVDSAAKRAVLLEERDRLGEGAAVLGLGDGANDIPMLEAADYGVAYHAKPAASAAANGSIVAGDLTAILHLLQVPRGDWVAVGPQND